ncbi:MAG: 30S ribosomal protein S9 [Gemmataceae bacterium]
MAEKKKDYHWGTGRRKTSVARVRLSTGSGQIVVNGRSVEQYFTEEKDRAAVYGPLNVTDLAKRVDVHVNVKGGGITGQAGAICQGMARAIVLMFGEAPAAATSATPAVEGAAPAPAAEGSDQGGLHKRLRDSGFLTRDGRMKERKKYGRKGARRSFQFSKR